MKNMLTLLIILIVLIFIYTFYKSNTTTIKNQNYSKEVKEKTYNMKTSTL